MPGKAANDLGDDKVFAVCEELRALAHKPKLKQIQAILAKHGVELSLMGATTFRDQDFAEHLARLRRGSQMATAITESVANGVDALDASVILAKQELLDCLTDVDAEGRPNLEKISGIIVNLQLAVSSKRDTERKQQETDKKLEYADQRIAKLEREKTDWDEKRAKITAQLDKARTATPADADQVRAAAVAEIDRIMGIKTK